MGAPDHRGWAPARPHRGRCLQAGGRARPGGAPPRLAVRGPWRTGPGSPWLHQIPLWGSNRACSAQPHSLQMNALPESARGFRDSVPCPTSCCWLVRGRSVGNLAAGASPPWSPQPSTRDPETSVGHTAGPTVPGSGPTRDEQDGASWPGGAKLCGGWCLLRGLRRARRTGLRGFRGEQGR